MGNMNEIEIFEGKSLSDLFKEIYTNSNEKKTTMTQLVEDLRPLVKESGDAMLLVPMIKEYLEVSVKNDENLIKLAMVIQRLIAKQSDLESASEFGLSEEEKAKLIAEAEKVYENVMENSSSRIIGTAKVEVSSSKVTV